MQSTEERRIQNDRLTRTEMRRRERIRKKKLRRRITILIVLVIAIGGAIGTGMYAVQNGGASIPVVANLISKLNSRGGTDTTNNNSQETMEPVKTEEPKNLIPSPDEETDLINIISHAGMKKRCYLTFDDGPSTKVTPQILDILANYGAKATFFEVGKYIENNPDMAKRVHDEGHLIANHSYSHDYDALYASEESFKNEMEKCYEVIKNVTGEEEPFKLIRFPGGSYNAGDHAAEKQQYKQTLADMGFYYCDWNSLNGDAEGKKKNADELVQYFKNSSVGFNNLIVLMHDTDAKQSTADALPAIIEYLQGQGYTFHRLDDIDYNPPQPTAASTAAVAVQ